MRAENLKDLIGAALSLSDEDVEMLAGIARRRLRAATSRHKGSLLKLVPAKNKVAVSM